MRWVSFIHERRTVNRRAPVPRRKRCSIFALPEPNWWMATSGWLARPYGYSGTMGNVPEAAISGTMMLPMVSDIGLGLLGIELDVEMVRLDHHVEIHAEALLYSTHDLLQFD